MSRTILVVGQGGREHAIAWKLSSELSPEDLVLVAPGNSGTSMDTSPVARARGRAKMENCPVAVDDLAGLEQLARVREVEFTVVGPEVPLALGLVDRFIAAGLPIFGPSALAAELEASKAFTKDFLQRHGIPTARYQVFTAVESALEYLRTQSIPIVIKADGLAAGKGVVVATERSQAENAVHDMLSLGQGTKQSGESARIVIEEFLPGVEASYIVVASGEEFVALASSQDHKRVGDGDTGPNTGGMGAISPTPVVTPEIEARIQAQIIRPTLAGMQAEGRRFCGFLYAGVMIDPEGQPRVLEFNARLGDPETQALMSRLQSPLLPLLQAASAGKLANYAPLQWDSRVALGVVLCAEGYPGTVRKGDRISDGGNAAIDQSAQVFHAGSKLVGGHLLSDGGRVLCVVGFGDNMAEAQARAYARADQITWPGRFMRRDIGWRAL